MGKLFNRNKSKTPKKSDNANKNKKLSGNIIKIKVNRLLNGTPVEIAVFEGELIRDENNNTVIFNEDMNFKEEIPGIQDTLISDILSKLKSRSNSKEQQLKDINKAISNQEEIIKEESNGFILKKRIVHDEEEKRDVTIEEKVKINRQTEMSKLRILKCSKYALELKAGDGFFESIDIAGNRTLEYVIIDGELIPYWYKTPSNEGEPVILVPDVVGRKKFFKESETEAIQDFNESVDWFWKGWLGIAMKLLVVIAFAGLIVWTAFNARWSSDLYDDSLEPRIQELQLQNEKIRQQCNEGLAQQIENNEYIIDYAKTKMTEDLSNPAVKDVVDKSNIKI